MPAMVREMKNDNGFTLIEIAIVLIILGLLVGLGAGLIGPLTKRAKLIESRELMDAAVESVISYGAANNKLPTTGNFSSTVKNPNDAWTKSLYYILDTNLTDSSIGGLCGRKSTNLTLRICPDTGCSSPTNTISNVAFIVLSGAGNYNNQTAGTQAVSSATTISSYEVDVNVDGYASDVNRSEPYDDIVKWVTIDELRIKAGCVGPQLKVVNNELPYGYESSAYSATVFGDGGVPFSSGGNYRWCRQESASISGLTFSPSTQNSDCSSLTESSWGKADEITISGTPTTNGSFSLTFFVRDDNDSSGTNDNVAQKTLVMTINPASGGSGCSTSCSNFRVWNDYSSNRDFSIDATCRENVNNGSEATTSWFRLDSGETINRHSGRNHNCSDSIAESLTFDEAACADTDGDCRVYISGSDR